MVPRKKFQTIDEYINTFPEDIQEILENLRKVIHKAAPEAKEAIIYGIPTFKLDGNLVHFAAYKNILDFIPHLQALKHLKKRFQSIKTRKVLYNSPWINQYPLIWWKKLLFFVCGKT